MRNETYRHLDSRDMMGPLREDPPGAEFDAYAVDYAAGMDNPLKRCLGSVVVSFVEVKVDWLLRAMRRRGRLEPLRATTRLLDYGCAREPCWMCCDNGDMKVSWPVATFLPRCSQRLGAVGPEALRRELSVIESHGTSFDAASFDVVVLSAVLHHVEPSVQASRVHRRYSRVLKPGGQVYIFEHNPYNPVTQWVVRHTPIDRNAVLLRPVEVHAELAKAGAGKCETTYLMFSPPRMTFCLLMDRALYWLPLGTISRCRPRDEEGCYRTTPTAEMFGQGKASVNLYSIRDAY